jgi:hypothetical protein
MFNPDPNRWLNRCVALVAGLVMVSLGLRPVLLGHMHYVNWFGGLVFAPLGILFGLIVIVAAIFKPHWLQAPPGNR